MTLNPRRPGQSQLSLPSDSITSEFITQIDPFTHPNFATWRGGIPDDVVRSTIDMTMRLKEKVLVAKAVAAAMGQPDPYPRESRKEVIEMLAKDYQLFGLSTGPKHTEQLVRDFERAAVARERADGGKGRS